MSSFLAAALPNAVFVSHVLFAVLVLSFIADKSWRKKVIRFVGENGVLLAFLVSLSAVLGSLFYSEVLGYEPCVLCWWLRVFTYPLAVIFGLALYKKTRSAGSAAFMFAVPLVIIASVIALYFSYTSVGGASLLSCTAAGGACSRIYVKVMGYITIPSMSLTSSVFVLAIAWVKKLYDEDSHS